MLGGSLRGDRDNDAAGAAAAGPDDPDVARRARDSHSDSSASSVMIDARDGGRQATIDEWAAPADAPRGAAPAAAVDAEADTDDGDDAGPGLDSDLEARIERNTADIETLSRTLASIIAAIRERPPIGERDDWTPNRGFQ